MKRYTNSENKLTSLLNFFSKHYAILVSLLVLLFVYIHGFKSLSWYTVLLGVAISFSIAHKVFTFKKQSSSISLTERIETAILIAVYFEALFEMAGRQLFPLLYITAPFIYIYVGSTAAICGLALTAITELTLNLHELKNLYWLIPLPIFTFAPGYLLSYFKKEPTHNTTLKKRKRKLERRNFQTEETALTSQEPEESLKKTNHIRNSLEILNNILSPHSIVLYLLRDDGSFEIEDFISSNENQIDRGQKLIFKSGYIGWVAKTKTPLAIDNLKNQKENLPYYAAEVPIRSFFAAPIIREEDKSIAEKEPLGILVIDSLSNEAFGEKEKLIASLACANIVEILSKVEITTKAQSEVENQSSLSDFVERINSTLDPEAIYDSTINILVNALEADFVAITLRDGEKNSSKLKRTGRERRKDLEDKAFSHENTLIGTVYQNKTSLSFGDFSTRKNYTSLMGKEIDFALAIQSIKSILISPIRGIKRYSFEQDEIIVGCIVLGRIEKSPFSDSERKLAGVITQEAWRALSNALTHIKANSAGVTDELTSLYNKQYFHEVFSHALARSDRYPESVSLAIVQIDNLNEMEEVHGKQTRDNALALTGQTISKSFRKLDVAAVFGQDKFIVALPNTDKKGAIFASKKLKRNLRLVPLKYKGAEIEISLSIGIATYPDNAKAKEALIEKAEAALEAARHDGGNRIIHCEDIFLEEVAD